MAPVKVLDANEGLSNFPQNSVGERSIAETRFFNDYSKTSNRTPFIKDSLERAHDCGHFETKNCIVGPFLKKICTK